MINALRWLATFLETRFPVQVDPATYAMKEDVRRLEGLFSAKQAEIEKLQKQIEILNLRVGLTRATQSPFGRKVNG